MTDLLAATIAEHGLRAEVREAGQGVYVATLRSPRAQATRRLAFDRPPEARDLLLHLGLRALTLHECEGLADWADDEDLDPGDPAVKAEYERLRRDEAALTALLGGRGFQALVGGLLISQAIGAARAGLGDPE